MLRTRVSPKVQHRDLGITQSFRLNFLPLSHSLSNQKKNVKFASGGHIND